MLCPEGAVAESLSDVGGFLSVVLFALSSIGFIGWPVLLIVLYTVVLPACDPREQRIANRESFYTPAVMLYVGQLSSSP